MRDEKKRSDLNNSLYPNYRKLCGLKGKEFSIRRPLKIVTVIGTAFFSFSPYVNYISKSFWHQEQVFYHPSAASCKHSTRRGAPLEMQLFIYLLFLGCFRSLLLCTGFLYLRQAGATLRCGAWAYCGGFSCCGAQALGAWASVVVA